MLLALKDRQTVIMRTQYSREHRIPVEKQMLRRDGRGEPATGVRIHKVRGLFGGDVLEHDLERGKRLEQRLECIVKENCFLVENVDIRVSALTVNEKGHP